MAEKNRKTKFSPQNRKCDILLCQKNHINDTIITHYCLYHDNNLLTYVTRQSVPVADFLLLSTLILLFEIHAREVGCLCLATITAATIAAKVWLCGDTDFKWPVTNSEETLLSTKIPSNCVWQTALICEDLDSLFHNSNLHKYGLFFFLL